MQSAIKIQLDLDKEIEMILDGQSKIANWLYNHLLEKANKMRSKYIETLSQEIAQALYTQRGLCNLVPGLKKEFNFLGTLYSSVLKNVALTLSDTIRTYQKTKKAKGKQKRGWPKFRSFKKKWFSLLYEEPWKGYTYQNGKIILSLGKNEEGKQIRIELKLKESFPDWYAPENVRQLRIVKQNKVYYAIFVVERTLKPCKDKKDRIIAIDPNHKNLGYGVGTCTIATEILNPYFLKILDKQIDKIKSRRDKCKKKSKQIHRPDGSSCWCSSRRWDFFNDKLQTLYQKRRDQIKTYLYTIANRLCKEYDVIAIGDYTPHGGGITTKMRRAMNNQSVIGNFKTVVSWVAQRSSKSFMEWQEKGSTRTCHECGYIRKEGIAPGIREWKCPQCNTFHIRDENAAKNGLRKVLQDWSISIKSCSVQHARFWKFDGQGIQEIPKFSKA